MSNFTEVWRILKPRLTDHRSFYDRIDAEQLLKWIELNIILAKLPSTIQRRCHVIDRSFRQRRHICEVYFFLLPAAVALLVFFSFFFIATRQHNTV